MEPCMFKVKVGNDTYYIDQPLDGGKWAVKNFPQSQAYLNNDLKFSTSHKGRQYFDSPESACVGLKNALFMNEYHKNRLNHQP